MQDYILPTVRYAGAIESVDTFDADFRIPTEPLASVQALQHAFASTIIQVDKLRGQLLHKDTSLRNEVDNTSMREHLGFLVTSDREVWYQRTQQIISNDIPTFAHIPIMELLAADDWQNKPMDIIIGQFMRIRWNSSSQVCGLDESMFSRIAFHPQFGSISLHEILQYRTEQDSYRLRSIHNLLDHAPAIEQAN
jgi:hypothetical protein